jgi:hypothetical protein
MLCFARACAWQKTLLGIFLLFAGELALANVPQVPDWTREKVAARVETALGGSFMSVDPVLTDSNTGASFNRYVYANNSPYNNVDPDGRNPVLAARLTYAVSYQVATRAGLGIVGAYLGAAVYDLVNSPAQNSNSSSGENSSATASSPGASNGESKSGEGGAKSDNNNPYKGPVKDPVIAVDSKGNAIPVGQGEKINASPNGDFQQVQGSDNKPTGVRLDAGGHPKQNDPRAQAPHAHRPGVTTADGNPHLPVNKGDSP